MNLSFHQILIVTAANLIFLLVFTRYKQSLQFFTLLIYSITASATIAGIFLRLDFLYILGLSLAFLAVLYLLYGKTCLISPVSPNASYMMLVVLAYFVSFQIQQNFVGGQDAHALYLPYTRYLASHHEFPNSLINLDAPYLPNVTAYPPMLVSLGNLILTSFPGTGEAALSLIPSVFFVAFLLVLFSWYEKENDNPWVLCVLLLLSPFFIERSSWYTQESLILFSCTLLFYTLYMYEKEGQPVYLTYAVLVSGLGMLAKYNGLLFTLFLAFFILSRRVWDWRLWALFLVVHLPAAIWHLRNFYYFGSPMFPFMSSMAFDSTIKENLLFVASLNAEKDINRLTNFFINYCILFPFFSVWIFAFPMAKSLRRNSFYKSVYIFAVLYILLFLFIFTAVEFRYFMPFYGLVLVQLGVVTESLWKDFSFSNYWQSNSMKQPAIIVGLVFLIMLGVQTVYVHKIFPDHVSPHIEAVDFLRNNEHVPAGTAVFSDTDHGLCWYGDFKCYNPMVLFWAKEFVNHRDRHDMFGLFSKYKIRYVINHPWNSPWEDVFAMVEQDKRHFQLIYSDKKNAMKIWRVNTTAP